MSAFSKGFWEGYRNRLGFQHVLGFRHSIPKSKHLGIWPSDNAFEASRGLHVNVTVGLLAHVACLLCSAEALKMLLHDLTQAKTQGMR